MTYFDANGSIKNKWPISIDNEKVTDYRKMFACKTVKQAQLW